MPDCKWRFPVLPVLTYFKYAPLRITEKHHFRRRPDALDCGATGVVAPHIRNAAEAAAFARACRYGAGGRGYTGS